MDKVQTKAAVSVSDMARMVGLSRARFYQLQGAAFPKPVYDAETGRPFYNEELQQVCLEVRRRNCGIDGKPVLFYARRTGSVVPTVKRKKKPSQPKQSHYAEIIEGVRALGLTTVTAAQVEAAVSARYNAGIEGVDQVEIIRAVFLDLKRQNSGDSVR